LLLDGGRLSIGHRCFFNYNFSVTSMEEVRIGSNVIVGENVKIYDQNHNYKKRDVLINKQGYNSAKVTIEDNVWIGSNVVILAGVTIGTGSVIGAGNVVYRSIPANTLLINKQEQLQKEIKDDENINGK